jgi:hypothetical protein
VTIQVGSEVEGRAMPADIALEPLLVLAVDVIVQFTRPTEGLVAKRKSTV